MYASRIYVPRIRVPLLRYFVLVIPALLGFLYVAEAVMGPPPPMRLATTSSPALLKKQAAVMSGVQILSAPEAIAVPASQLSQIETTASVSRAGSTPAIVQSDASAARAEGTAVPAAKTTKKAAAEHKKKSTKIARVQDLRVAEKRDRFAGFVQEPRPYGAVW